MPQKEYIIDHANARTRDMIKSMRNAQNAFRHKYIPIMEDTWDFSYARKHWWL